MKSFLRKEYLLLFLIILNSCVGDQKYLLPKEYPVTLDSNTDIKIVAWDINVYSFIGNITNPKELLSYPKKQICRSNCEMIGWMSFDKLPKNMRIVPDIMERGNDFFNDYKIENLYKRINNDNKEFLFSICYIPIDSPSKYYYISFYILDNRYKKIYQFIADP